MRNPELAALLRCPQSGAELVVADAGLVAHLNQAIVSGKVLDASGHKLVEAVDGGFVRSDGQVLYPILNGIPVLLAESAIRLDQVPP